MERKMSFVFLLCVLLLGLSGIIIQGGQVQQVERERRVERQIERPKRSSPPLRIHKFISRKEAKEIPKSEKYPKNYIEQNGLASANANTSNGKIWVIAMNDDTDPRDYAHAGFWTNGFQNVGPTPEQGVTVTATVNVIHWQRDFQLKICIYSDEQIDMYYLKNIYSVGNISLTTDPFSMEPNKVYSALVFIRPRLYDTIIDQENAIVAEITDISWNF